MVDWSVDNLVDGVQQAGDILQETEDENLLNWRRFFKYFIN